MNAIEIVSFLAILVLLSDRLNVIYKGYKSRHSVILTDSPSSRAADQDAERLGWFSIVLLLIALALVCFSFYAPFFLTKTRITPDFDFSGTGQIGDTIGGLMNPFIALAGVIVTGLAFYMQYRANQIQRQLFLEGQNASNTQFQRQLNHQQFESQFYEMLRLHKENVNEMELPGKRKHTPNGNWENTVISKREVFRQMQLEFESLLDSASTDPKTSLVEAFDSETPAASLKLSQERFTECYSIFFWGYDSCRKYDLPEDCISDIRNIVEDRYPSVTEFETMRAAHLNFEINAFQGHSSRLGHYFRHLYMMVKFVVKNPLLTEHKDKMRYLKILRAQLSNYEQIMIFYNWLSGYGKPWEDDRRRFFTQYKMIHNLWHDQLFKNQLVIDKLEFLKERALAFKPGDLFEIGDDFSRLKVNNSPE